MEPVDAMVGVVGYSLAALAFLFLTGLLLTGFRDRLRGLFLAFAAVATAVWGLLLAVQVVAAPLTAFGIYLLEFSLDFVWLLFLSSLMGLGVGGVQFVSLRRWSLGIALALILAGFVLEWAFATGRASAGADQLLIIGQVVTSLLVLINVEQIIRNARQQQLRGLKYLCLSIAAIFAYDLVMYSHATLAEGISPALWAARGYVAAMALPLIIVAVSRTPTWSGAIFISRQVVFHTTTVFVAGAYLTFIGFAGQYIRQYGGTWGGVAQVVFFSAAILGFCVFLFSERMRLHLRVFISKHFYRNKYDYRQEWLRMTETMTSQTEALPLQKRAVKALAEIVGAPGGSLWLKSADGSIYRVTASWNVATVHAQLATDSPAAEFLRSSGWIVDFIEFEKDPTRYEGLEIEVRSLGVDDARFIIPLSSEQDLIGFVVLSRPTTDIALDYEDHDLLKTAGRQIASYISQESATELLAQGKQFEAFNKLTAYLMHDLKNVIAQQSLLVQNAEKHKHNPDFIDDAIATIKSGVARMKRVIEQLKQGSVQQSVENVELGKLVLSAVSQCADRAPVPRVNIGDDQIWVRADKDRLQMAVFHAIRNAQDATSKEGDISVELTHGGSECQLKISDNGAGMDRHFVQERLFRPFDSTKGPEGMGIGAHQIRETVSSIGGRLDVESSPGEGTTFKIVLPIYG